MTLGRIKPFLLGRKKIPVLALLDLTIKWSHPKTVGPNSQWSSL